ERCSLSRQWDARRSCSQAGLRRVAPDFCSFPPSWTSHLPIARCRSRGKTPMWERARCGFTTPHHVDEARNKLQMRVLLSTDDAHRSDLTRRNIGTCAVFRAPYIDVTRVEGKGWDLASQQRLQVES